MFLIAAISLSTLLNWAEVAVGLGLVIFVHELGHFMVAKLCGVKCEKFYLGFDIGGLKLLKFQWGETEYGIGVLPLGGYVKMLGQEDNPSKAYEEIQRAKQHQAAPPPVESWAADRTEESEDVTYDPRSYLAQSVPKRMAIISAGVIMNLLFAFVMASVAYAIGVKYMPSVIAGLVPGQPAWNANMQVGDEILKIGKIEHPRYVDLITSVALSNLDEGVQLTLKRGSNPPFEVVLHPQVTAQLPKIGVSMPRSLKLYDKDPVRPKTSAAQADPPLNGGDVLVSADGQPLAAYADLDRILAQTRSKPLSVTVRRTKPNASKDAAKQVTEEITTTLAPNPVRDFGLQMAMGPLTAIQKDSPAERAGFKIGDQILAIDGESPGDPMTLPDRLYARAGEHVTFTLQHGDEPSRDVAVDLPEPADYEWPKILLANVVREVAGLGIAYPILNQVVAVEAESPAAKAGIAANDVLTEVTLIMPDKKAEEDAEEELGARGPLKIQFSDDVRNWVYVMSMMQFAPEGAKLKVGLKNGKTVEMAAVASTNWFNPDRGLILEPLLADRKASDLSEAMYLGGRETLDSTLQVYRFLRKLGHQIPLTELGGPGAIVGTASAAASAGFTQFLIFLVMLSANLAVLNFLPIPMLDGGHMVFLILEGIRRKPVSERVVLAFHYAGFLFIVTLMCFVLFLDIRRYLF